jgi:hypothetical protein
LTEINPSVPIEFVQLVDRLLAKEPSQRFASAEQIEQEADILLTALQAGKLRLFHQPRRVFSKVRLLSVAAVGIFLVGLLATWNIPLLNQAPVSNASQSLGSVSNQQTEDAQPEEKPQGQAITLKEFEAAKRALSALDSEYTGFQVELQSAQLQAASLDQLWGGQSTLSLQQDPMSQKLMNLQMQVDLLDQQIRQR